MTCVTSIGFAWGGLVASDTGQVLVCADASMQKTDPISKVARFFAGYAGLTGSPDLANATITRAKEAGALTPVIIAEERESWLHMLDNRGLADAPIVQDVLGAGLHYVAPRASDRAVVCTETRWASGVSDEKPLGGCLVTLPLDCSGPAQEYVVPFARYFAVPVTQALMTTDRTLRHVATVMRAVAAAYVWAYTQWPEKMDDQLEFGIVLYVDGALQCVRTETLGAAEWATLDVHDDEALLLMIAKDETHAVYSTT